MVYREPPAGMTRMAAVREAVPGAWLMDTGAAAVLGSLGDPVVAAARWDALGVEHYARRHHPELAADLVLPPAPVPPASTVWVVRRAAGGVKGDVTKLADLDRELAGRGMHLAGEERLAGRRSVVVVQRWVL